MAMHRDPSRRSGRVDSRPNVKPDIGTWNTCDVKLVRWGGTRGRGLEMIEALRRGLSN